MRLENESGKEYEVGYPKSAGYTREEVETKLASEQRSSDTNTLAGYKEIYWVPRGESRTSEAANKIGIVKGHVSEDSGAVYTYRLNFVNSKGWSFTFVDEYGDTYYCWTWRNGSHYIDYNSPQPTMVGVK